MILILNFGAQYAHLIARAVRELGVYSEIEPYTISAENVASLSPSGIILSGGPSSVYDSSLEPLDKKILELGIPILGICFGTQLLAQLQGGVVEEGQLKEYGKKTLSVTNHGTLLKGLSDTEEIWMSHGDLVRSLPQDFSVLATTDSCPVAAFEHKEKGLYGLQFHPEVVHTPRGRDILKNFVFDICSAKQNWNVGHHITDLVEQIQKQVQNEHVIMAVSGGVDSTVSSFLIHKALGERFHCVFVDNGLLRKNEVQEVQHMFSDLGFKNFHLIDARELFLSRLKGITDPEEKRKIIGHTFIEVFEKKAKELGNISFLGQGTIYPDRVESAGTSAHASKIKSHHNVALPETMKLQLVEPLKEFYKDEVRELGKELGIPKEVLERHPFPGPGLAVRVLGEITKERLDLLREADHIFIQELKQSGHYDKTWQAFAALLPVRAVGVKGDGRSFDYIISLRAVVGRDAMTADWARLPHEFLQTTANKILNSVEGVGRVLYDISQKPPATIEYE